MYFVRSLGLNSKSNFPVKAFKYGRNFYPRFAKINNICKIKSIIDFIIILFYFFSESFYGRNAMTLGSTYRSTYSSTDYASAVRRSSLFDGYAGFSIYSSISQGKYIILLAMLHCFRLPILGPIINDSTVIICNQRYIVIVIKAINNLHSDMSTMWFKLENKERIML